MQPGCACIHPSACLNCVLPAARATGTSNIVTALLGAGYTGSYIFSQTIFTMRSGVRTRISSMMVAGIEFAVFVMPFSVVSVGHECSMT